MADKRKPVGRPQGRPPGPRSSQTVSGVTAPAPSAPPVPPPAPPVTPVAAQAYTAPVVTLVVEETRRLLLPMAAGKPELFGVRVSGYAVDVDYRDCAKVRVTAAPEALDTLALRAQMYFADAWKGR